MKRLMLLAGVLSLSVSLCAETLVVQKGATVDVTSSQTVDALEVHGTLNVSGSSANPGTVLSFKEPNTTVNLLGSDAGDSAVVNIGDYGSILGGRITFGPGQAQVVVGGKRTHDRTDETWDGQDAHWRCGYIRLHEDATSPTGVYDMIRLDKGGSMGLYQGGGQRIINPNPNVDARILFNGGRFSVYNAFSCAFMFMSSRRSDYPDDIPEGKGGRAIILEGQNGNPINLYLVNGGWTWPVSGVLKTQGDCDVVISGNGAPSYWNGFYLNGAIQWGHTGDLRLAGCFRMQAQANNVLPAGANNGNVVLEGNQYCYFDFNQSSQKANGVIVCGQASLTNSAANQAVLELGGSGKDGVYAVPRVGGSPIALSKVGSGTLTVTNTPSIAKMSVSAGQVVFADDDCTVGEMTLSGDTVVTVRGCTLTINALTRHGGRFETVDGGRVNVILAPSLDDHYLEIETSGIGLTTSSGGTLTLHNTAALGDDIHVAAGTLAFAKPGTTNRWLRFSFTKMYTGTFDLSELIIQDSAGARIDGGGSVVSKAYEREGVWSDGSAVKNVAPDVAPKDMPAQSIWSSDQTWILSEPAGGYRNRSPSAIFDGQTWSRVKFNMTPSVANPMVFVIRLPDAATDIRQYMIKNGYSGQTHPSDWIVETSADGINWTLPVAVTGQIPPLPNPAFYNNGMPYQILAGSPGSPGLVSTVNVQVDAGATLDCSGVAGGEQELAKLTVDMTAGGGMLKNVRLAETGSLALVNDAGTKKGGYAVPLTFVDSITTGNLSGWTLTVNGLPSDHRLIWKDGRLFVDKKGLVVIVR